MDKRMKYRTQLALFAIAVASILIVYGNLRASNMLEIKVDIGENIVETAKKSGVPKFSTRNIAGLVSYSVNSLPADIPVSYKRPGFEGSFAPLFALTMYADHDNKNNLAVTDLVLQFSTDLLTDHQSGQAFIERIIAQFGAKKWLRKISEFCPAVTGRSNFIEIDGTINSIEACPLDPAYKIAPAEWRTLAKSGLSYEWIGDGVIASLLVDASEDSRGITYKISLEYMDQEIKSRHDEKNHAEKLAEGDKKGWNSTSEYNAGIIELKEEIKLLEANAIKRGDSLVPREATPKK